MKTNEGIMDILAAYDLTESYRAAAELAECDAHTVARYVVARQAGQLSGAPVRREQVLDPYWEKVEEWVEQSHGRVRADVAQRKLEALGYRGSERTTRRAVAEAKTAYRAGQRRRFRPWLPEPGLWLQVGLRRRAAGDGAPELAVLCLAGLEPLPGGAADPGQDAAHADRLSGHHAPRLWRGADLRTDRQREDRHPRPRGGGGGPAPAAGGGGAP